MPLDSGEPRHPTTTTQPPPKLSEPLPCPRCSSSNTKFCYYNNYNLSQPRHFCKSCRRYWTHGGSLRNVPLGGSSRSASKHSSKRHRKPDSQSESQPGPIRPDPAQFHPNRSESGQFQPDRPDSVHLQPTRPDPVQFQPARPDGFQENGSFLSLLGEDQSGDQFVGFGGLGLGLGFGSGSASGSASGMGEIGGLGFGCDAWQMGEVVEGAAEGLVWPGVGLEVSMADHKNLK